MEEKKIFIRENKPEENDADRMEQMIRVVPRRYSLALAGGLIIAAAILCWVFLGEITITSSAMKRFVKCFFCFIDVVSS